MAHNLNIEDGRIAMAYFKADGAPWHKLGTAVEGAMTWAQALEAAHLDWSVGREPLVTAADAIAVPNRVALVRADTRAVLGTASSRYVPIQNREAFGLLDALAAGGEVKYHTVGALGRGETIWLLAKLPGTIAVADVDPVDRFLLLTNDHSGKRALRVLWTPIRVVCQNTLNAATAGRQREGASIRHCGDVPGQMDTAREVLGLAHRYFDDFASVVDKLAAHYPTRRQLDSYFGSLFPDPEPGPEAKDRASRARATRAELTRLFGEGMGHDAPEIRYSSWTAYNAVTEYVDHDRGRVSGRTRGSRERAALALQSSWLGSGAQIKHRAFANAGAMAGVN
jgi:phage/plasmid-like protein (TIGR03299 family)